MDASPHRVSVFLTETTMCCTCQREIHSSVRAAMSAAGVPSTVSGSVTRGLNNSASFSLVCLRSSRWSQGPSWSAWSSHRLADPQHRRASLHHHQVRVLGSRAMDTTQQTGPVRTTRCVYVNFVSWLCVFGVLCFRSTLVSKEPESMLAHMFREKGKLWQPEPKPYISDLWLCLGLNWKSLRWNHPYWMWFINRCVCSRCVGEQAGSTWGLPYRPQPWILWAYSQLPETRSAHYQWRHKYQR